MSEKKSNFTLEPPAPPHYKIAKYQEYSELCAMKSSNHNKSEISKFCVKIPGLSGCFRFCAKKWQFLEFCAKKL